MRPNRDRRRDPAPAKATGTPPTEVIQGLRAGLAVFAHRPDDIVRVLHARTPIPEIAQLVRWAESRRVPCLAASDPDLDRWATSAHHEGLCIVARARRWAPILELGEGLVRSKATAVALDRVRNPYNVGAILRSAAFFGVDGVLLGAPSPVPGLDATAVRVAEGAAEVLKLSRTTDLADSLGRLRSRGVHVFGADARATADALRFTFAKPAVLVVGHEREGLGARVRAQCDALVAIDGSGRMESLNVAVAAGILIAATTRAAG
jgi:TrmH RNA methyltransferase